MKRFLDMLTSAKSHHTGWPSWWVPTREGIRPSIVDNAIECALARDSQGGRRTPHHSDFWRAAPTGKLYLIRGYDEDSYPDRVAPGTGFDITTPTWRLGDALLHAAALSGMLGGNDAEILFRARWWGLNGRKLVSVGNPNRRMWGENYYCRQHDYITPDQRLASKSIGDGLPEIVTRMLAPLYELFDFFVLPPQLVAQELQNMRQNRF